MMWFTVGMLRSLRSRIGRLSWEVPRVVQHLGASFSTCVADGNLDDVGQREPDTDLRKVFSFKKREIKTMHNKMARTLECKNQEAFEKLLAHPRDSETHIADNLAMLEKLGFNKEDQKSLMMKSMSMFTEERRNLQNSIDWYLQDLGLSIEQFKRAVMVYPPLLHFDVDKKLNAFSQAFLEAGFTTEEVKAIVVKHPEAVGKAWHLKVAPMKSMMLERGLEGFNFVRLVAKTPYILRCKVEDRLHLIELLLEVGMTQDEVWKTLLEEPEVIIHSFDMDLKKKIDFFEGFGIPREQVVKRMMLRAPYSFCRVRLDTMKSAHKTMLSKGITDEGYTKIVTRIPEVLGQCARNVELKIDFAIEHLKRDVNQVVKWPTYLTFSLEDRIMFRAAAMASKGGDIYKVTFRNLLAPSNGGFFRRYDTPFDTFRSWWVGLTPEAKLQAFIERASPQV